MYLKKWALRSKQMFRSESQNRSQRNQPRSQTHLQGSPEWLQSTTLIFRCHKIKSKLSGI
jgi:hypothetical protein